jgi:hypothetical protein
MRKILFSFLSVNFKMPKNQVFLLRTVGSSRLKIKNQQNVATINLYQKPRTYYEPDLLHSLCTGDLTNIFVLFAFYVAFPVKQHLVVSKFALQILFSVKMCRRLACLDQTDIYIIYPIDNKFMVSLYRSIFSTFCFDAYILN